MAQDLTQKFKANEKKSLSIAATKISFGEIVDNTFHEVFKLPDFSIIKRAYLIVHSASQAAVTMDVGFEDGAKNELFDNAVMSAVTAVSATKSAELSLLTGTGKNVGVLFSAKPTQGEFTLVVEFIEYQLGNGNLMQINY
jgi:hypothetical protein